MFAWSNLKRLADNILNDKNIKNCVSIGRKHGVKRRKCWLSAEQSLEMKKNGQKAKGFDQ